MSESDPNRQGATAYHEAGHAVVGFHLGRGLVRINIVESDDRVGLTRWRPRAKWFWEALEVGADNHDYNRLRRAVEVDVMISWAGTLAEERFRRGRTGDTDPGFGVFELPEPERLSDGSEATHTVSRHSDADHILHLIESVSGSEEEATAYGEWLRLRTHGLLANPMIWARVQILAEAILERQSITGPDVAQLLTGESYSRRLHAMLDLPSDYHEVTAPDAPGDPRTHSWAW